MTERFYGAKYEEVRGKPLTEVAKKLRGDIKAAVKTGKLPKGLKVSVRKDHNSIDLTVTALPEGFTIHNREWVRDEHEGTDRRFGFGLGRLSPEAKALTGTVQAMAAAYNYDGSDIQTDYFDVNFYGGYLRFESKLEKADKARLLAEMFGTPEPEPEPEFGPKAVLAMMEARTHWTHWSASQVASEMHVSSDRARKQLDYLVNGCSLVADWHPTRRCKVYRLPRDGEKLGAMTVAGMSARADKKAAEAKAQAKATRDANKKSWAEYAAKREREAAELREKAEAARKAREARDREAEEALAVKEALAAKTREKARAAGAQRALFSEAMPAPGTRTYSLAGPVFVAPKYGVC